MTRFTTRDLLWLLLVVALCFGWLASVRHRARQFNARENRLLDRIHVLEHEAQDLRHQWDAAGAEMEKRGIEWPPAP